MSLSKIALAEASRLDRELTAWELEHLIRLLRATLAKRRVKRKRMLAEPRDVQRGRGPGFMIGLKHTGGKHVDR